MTSIETNAAAKSAELRAAADQLTSEAGSLADQIASLRATILVLHGIQQGKLQEAQVLRDQARDEDQRGARIAAEYREALRRNLAKVREEYGVEPLQLAAGTDLAMTRGEALSLLRAAARDRDEERLDRVRANTQVRAALTAQDGDGEA